MTVLGNPNNSNHQKKNNNDTIHEALPNKKFKLSNNNTDNIDHTSSITSNSISSITMTTIPSESTDGGDDDFAILKDYIRKSPLGESNPAVKAALEGIEKVEKRRIRDAKLRSKFGCSSATRTESSNNSDNADGDEIVVVEKDDAGGAAASGGSVILESSNSNDDDMEWQDVPQQQRDEDDMVPGDSFVMEQVGDDDDDNETEGCCYLGRTLAKACIDTIVEQQQKRPVVVSTPLAAIAVALHASLRSEELAFACTGIPEDAQKGKKGKSIGFAPPIRELPKSEFLPREWDKTESNHNNNNNQQPCLRSPDPLRYRKIDTGAVVLTVKRRISDEESGSSSTNDSGPGDCSTECIVTFVPANSKEDSTMHPSLRFPLSEHINLDSWNAAALKAGGNNKIAPSLHYKNLSGLLSKFCQTFDLGAVKNNDGTVMGGDGKSTPTGSKSGTTFNSKMEVSGVFAGNSTLNAIRNMESLDRKGYSAPSTLDQAFPPAASAVAAARRTSDPPASRLVGFPPSNPHPRGDFADDLLPSGLQDPRFGRVGGGSRMVGSGNLMGPNHPMFSLEGNSGFPGGNFGRGGPGTMQPRFDPLMPPGIADDCDLPPMPGALGGRGNRLGGDRRARGEPNPDHLPPPNSLGNNMFM